MKQRLNLTVDADLVRSARQVAHERDTSVSALVEEFLRSLPSHEPVSGAAFVAKWTGRLRPAPPDGEPRREYLWRKYDLRQHAAIIHEGTPAADDGAALRQEGECES